MRSENTHGPNWSPVTRVYRRAPRGLRGLRGLGRRGRTGRRSLTRTERVPGPVSDGRREVPGKEDTSSPRSVTYPSRGKSGSRGLGGRNLIGGPRRRSRRGEERGIGVTRRRVQSRDSRTYGGRRVTGRNEDLRVSGVGVGGSGPDRKSRWSGGGGREVSKGAVPGTTRVGSGGSCPSSERGREPGGVGRTTVLGVRCPSGVKRDGDRVTGTSG